MFARGWSQSLSVSVSEENYTHSYKRLTLIFCTIVIFLLSLITNAINSSGSLLFGLRLYSKSENSEKILADQFSTYHWLNYVWYFIYIYQFAWLCYGVSTIFRKSSSDYLYKYPPVMHWIIYLNFSLANILNYFCSLLWEHSYYGLTTFYSGLIFVSLYIAAFVSLFKLSDYQREMYYTEKTKDVWSIRILVQNGMFMFASWSFLMFLLVFSTTLSVKYELSEENLRLMLFILIVLKLILYFLIENFVAYKYFKFVFLPWIIYAIFLFNMIKIYETNGRNSKGYENDFFFYIFLLALYLFLFISKLIKFLWSEFFYNSKFSANF